jgi:hypothetical protein
MNAPSSSDISLDCSIRVAAQLKKIIYRSSLVSSQGRNPSTPRPLQKMLMDRLPSTFSFCLSPDLLHFSVLHSSIILSLALARGVRLVLLSSSHRRRSPQHKIGVSPPLRKAFACRYLQQCHAGSGYAFTSTKVTPTYVPFSSFHVLNKPRHFPTLLTPHAQACQLSANGTSTSPPRLHLLLQ